MSDEFIDGVTSNAYASHGSGLAIPALLDRLFFSGENIREGVRLHTIGQQQIQPFVNAWSVLYIEVFGILRSSMKKADREPIEKEFKDINEVIKEIMKKPDNRLLKKDTITLYDNVSNRMTEIWFLLNDFFQGQKQFYVRAGTTKDNLFEIELDRLKSMK